MEVYKSSSYQENGFQTVLPAKKYITINFLDGFEAPFAKNTPDSRQLLIRMAKILAAIGIVMFVVYFAPGILEFAKYKFSGNEVNKLTEATQGSSQRVLPAYNSSFPKTNRLIISAIGVDTDIEEATYNDYETALKKGVWRVSDFGQPDKAGAPIILAAHRFGYVAWTNSYRHYNSFYNLPKVEIGDTVKIYWQQREYVYGVYMTKTAREITDYSADLILYTCESLTGEDRIFVYAKQIS